MKLYGFILALAIFSTYFLPNILTYIIIASLIYKILRDLHIIGEPAFTLGTIKKTDIYYINLKGSYKKVTSYLKEVDIIYKKFNLDNNYNAYKFGLYYDDPKKVQQEDLRCILGIGLTSCENSNEINEYLVQQGWSKNTIPPTSAVITRMQLLSYSFKSLALIQYYKYLNKSLSDKEFVQRYKIKDTEKLPGIMEVYEKNQILFYIPCGNFDKFDFYKPNEVKKI